MPEIELQMPEHWKNPRVAANFSISVFAVLVALCLIWVLYLVGRRDYLTSVFAVGLLLCFLFLLVLALQVRLGRVVPQATSEADGTYFRPPRAKTRFLELSIVSAIVSGISFVCYVPSGRLAIGIGGARQIYYPIIVAGLVCWLSYLLLRGRSNGWGYLKLSPEGFEVSNSVTTTASGAWDDVMDVIDQAPKGKAVSCPAVTVMTDGEAQTINSLPTYQANGAALYWAIRHYWLYPENRGELANGRAIERLRAQDFEVE